MTPVAEAHDVYVAEFERAAAARAAEPAWLRGLREEGIRRFAASGFPTTRDEEWKFTNISPIASAPFAAAAGEPPDLESVTRLVWTAGPDSPRLVFVNGRFAPRLSTNVGHGRAGALRHGSAPAGLAVDDLASVIAARPEALEPFLGRQAALDRHPFAALNTAFAADGAFVRIAPGTIVEPPIQILFVHTDRSRSISHPRVVIAAGAHSQCRIVETYAGEAGTYFTNAVTEIAVESSAVVDHYRIQHESMDGFHIGLSAVHAGRAATVSSHAIALGGAIARHDVVAVLDGEGVDCTLNGLYLSDGRRLVDTHTTIDHAKPHCSSHEVYKGVLAGHGRAVFNGKIVVRPDAQKTDAKQTNRALLLSDDATINTKPQLEIFADDVKCTHGAAVGQLDEDALFYLRSRGLTQKDARDLLIHAFAADILTRVKVEDLRARLEQALTVLLPHEVTMP
jgi:Fe-S cluster assembly protein SufD